MKDDSEANKSKILKEFSNPKERNENGVIISGAEKFRLGFNYNNACLSSWRCPPQEQEKVSSWMKNAKPFLVMLGGCGTGKTYLCAAILNYYHEHDREIFYTTHRRFIEEIHRGIENGKTQHSVVNKMAEKECLILDDLGASQCTEWQQEMILELIDQRYSNARKTFITTNLTREEIKQRLGFRTESRIFDKNNQVINSWVEDCRTAA